MLRQIHIFLKSELIFVKDYAMALGNEELNNVKKIIQRFIDMPVAGKTFTNHISKFQIFHRSSGYLYFVLIADLSDSLQYIENIMVPAIEKFNELFPNPKDLKGLSSSKSEFSSFLDKLQKDLHTKIAIIGPSYAGKTTLYNLLKSGEEKIQMDFAKTSSFEIDGISFYLWDFVLKNNFSPLWSKFIAGSDVVILLFNLANYHLKIITHFLNLQKLEGKNSKLLMIGNKRDLVEDSEIKRIKNELNIAEFKEISLNSPDAKAKMLQFVMEILGLKKKFPKNFGIMVKEADNLIQEGKKVQALAKYKELLSISKSYQNIIYTKALEQKISNLNKIIKEYLEKRKELQSKKDFTVDKSLIFTRKITVKSLPSASSANQKISIQKVSSTPPLKPLEKMTNFQKIDKKKEIKPLKISIKLPIRKAKPSIPKVDARNSLTTKSIDAKHLKPQMPMKFFSPNGETTAQENYKPKVINFIKELQNLITDGGSSLSVRLCEQLIADLKNSLKRPISLNDIKLAADFFVKQEQLE